MDSQRRLSPKLEERQPYGTFEQIYLKKRQFPTENIHYSHHDSVLPSKEFVKQFEDYQKRKIQAQKLALNSEQFKHFSSEYKRTFQMGSPELQEKIKYIVPGESAGKKTFKKTLVNKAAEEILRQSRDNSLSLQSTQQLNDQHRIENRDKSTEFQKQSMLYGEKQEQKRETTPINFRKSIYENKINDLESSKGSLKCIKPQLLKQQINCNTFKECLQGSGVQLKHRKLKFNSQPKVKKLNKPHQFQK
eukprot:403362713